MTDVHVHAVGDDFRHDAIGREISNLGRCRLVRVTTDGEVEPVDHEGVQLALLPVVVGFDELLQQAGGGTARPTLW